MRGRRVARPQAEQQVRLEPHEEHCRSCGTWMPVAYHAHRKILTVKGLVQLRLVVRRCPNPACQAYKQPYRPEEEGRWALPHGECGLDLIALVGRLRYREQRSAPEMQRILQERGLRVCERTVEHLMHRYEELVTLHLSCRQRLHTRFSSQGRVILAIDGLQPDVGHEVLWVIREVLTGEIVLARALLSSTQEDLSGLLTEVKEILSVPVHGIISDGQLSIRRAVASVFPEVPHQLCHFHYLREAGKLIFEADRHAKKELKKQVRGVRPIERAVESRTDAEAEVIHEYALAVRASLTDDGLPPLSASGLRLQERLQAIHDSLERVGEKRGFPARLND
ncbi:MULE transposase, conserved domain [Ktedonobacter racemifer DSM 44963]|uniref:MULE transposase, conserved domain n=1 Tax=Ktedonobacter racemifer DSM 44963 TaxID=485913 RepID=D6TCL3_KTERA|nr:MULE transposase, conserved domain [Ktedonobacter racemifer DSM 44963]EFH83018.1 MULE transposase, conserved domain [Ktedonobacter racemifer DSM 44963]EFH86316.1 MULE transposase, conserved domain [Ktedonobacter racemifer DSM 44963]EFH88127.1 MULE transposase, conserved domain [Ktedonobacter racemifer DSM 44963]